MTNFITISGQTVSGLAIGAGTALRIGAGGTAINTIVRDGASELVVSGGVTISSTIRAGGFELVSSGGTAAETGVKDGGRLEISSGGLAGSAMVNAGGTMIVSAGGIATGTTSGAAAVVMVTSVVQSGQVANGLVIGSNTILDVASGGLAISTTVVDGGIETVLSGGSATSTSVSGAGVMNVSSGGTVSGTVVSSGGAFTLLSGASMAGTVVSSGANAAITLVVRSGVTSSGIVANSVTSVFVLSGGTATGMTVQSGGTVLVAAGGSEINTVVAAGGFDAISGLSVNPVVLGSLDVRGGIVSGAIIAGGGRVTVESSLLGASVVSDTTINGSGSLQIADGSEAKGMIVFGGQGSIVVESTTMPFAVLSGFGIDGSIDLKAIPYASGGTASFGDGSLVISENNQREVLQFVGSDPNGTLVLTPDQGSGTLVTLVDLPCFAAGSLIATDRGPVAVEHLVVGHYVLTASGAAEPIIWVGHRRLDCRRHPDPARIRPVRIRAHAFGPGLPGRDLYLSPDHAIFAEGVLIPVKHLMNGGAISQVEAEQVSYHHVELRRHAVILAENLPVESYLDTGDRRAFSELGDAMTLHPAFGSERADIALLIEALGCAPLRVTGPEVDRVRAVLADTVLAPTAMRDDAPRF
ncbi:MAG: hypothetical protein HIU92_13560 [Proteobacteria bacterium]|nr:hypothetical protein [Pseudomonadota bacterium]